MLERGGDVGVGCGGLLSIAELTPEENHGDCFENNNPSVWENLLLGTAPAGFFFLISRVVEL